MCDNVIRHLTSRLGSRGSRILEPRAILLGGAALKARQNENPRFLLTSRVYPHYGNTHNNLYLFHGRVSTSRRIHCEVSELQIYLEIDMTGAFFVEGIVARIRVKHWFLRQLRRPARKAM